MGQFFLQLSDNFSSLLLWYKMYVLDIFNMADFFSDFCYIAKY